MKTTFCTAALLGLVIGCGGSDWKQQVESKVVNQASFDLGCDAKKIRIQQIDDNAIAMGHMYTYGARGCGNRATYKAMCASMGAGCTVTNDAQAAAK